MQRRIIFWLLLLTFLPLGGDSLAQGQVVDKIIALVDDQVITQSDLAEALTKPMAELRNIPVTRSRQQILQDMIDEKVLVAEVEREKLTVTDQEISQALQGMLSQRGQTELELQEELVKDGLSLEKLRQQIELDLKRSRFLQKIIYPRVRVTDYDLQEYYKRHGPLFQGFEKIRFYEILLTQESMPPGEKLAAWATKIAASLKKGGSFQETARKFSRGAFAANGGDSGLIETSSMRTDLVSLLLSLPPNKISDPIAMGEGFFIFKVVERQNQRLRPYGEVKEQVHQMLIQEKVKDELDRYLAEARSRHYIDIRQ